MGRQRKQAPATEPETLEDLAPAPEADDEAQAEQDADTGEDEGTEDESEEPEAPSTDAAPAASAEPTPPGAGPKAQPLSIEETRVKLPRRNLSGAYKCKTRVRKDGSTHLPGTTLTLTDAEARHFLKFEAVEPLD